LIIPAFLVFSRSPQRKKIYHIMKKLVLLLSILALLYSCQKDDDALVPQCNLATNITTTTTTSSTVTLNWDHDTAEATFSLEYGISGFSQGSGTSVDVSATSTLLTGLMANTTYDLYLRANCTADNFSSWTAVQNFTTAIAQVVPELRSHLSDLNIYIGNLNELNISPTAFEYNLSTPLFSDYSHKQRIIALPENTSMEFNGEGLPIFPDNTVIAKTFFYNLDERNLSLGRIIIETRILLKINGGWETGDYKWNEAQTEAVLDLAGSELPVTWIDAEGTSNSITYKIPSNMDCATCHNTYDEVKPIGPKLRTLNFDIDGVNQLEQFIANDQLTGISSSASVRNLPNWEDPSISLASRARAYMDINCAHCHIPGGTGADEATLNLAFETSLEATNILEQTFLIDYRITADVEGIRMPFIGTTIFHTEGVELIQAYLSTLE
jgi:uncharacterized repeat protein (TIGR03806 family)